MKKTVFILVLLILVLGIGAMVLNSPVVQAKTCGYDVQYGCAPDVGPSDDPYDFPPSKYDW